MIKGIIGGDTLIEAVRYAGGGSKKLISKAGSFGGEDIIAGIISEAYI